MEEIKQSYCSKAIISLEELRTEAQFTEYFYPEDESARYRKREILSAWPQHPRYRLLLKKKMPASETAVERLSLNNAAGGGIATSKGYKWY